MKGRHSYLVVLTYILISTCLIIPSSRASVPQSTLGRYYDLVEVPGDMLDSAAGHEIKSLALYAKKNGAWDQVLVQVDEKTEKGDFVLPKGPEANGSEADGKFDARDVIAFMARDAGEKAAEGEIPDGVSAMDEIELKDPDSGKSAWIYLAVHDGNAPECKAEPVAKLIDTGGVFNFRFPSYGYDGLINAKEKKDTPTIFINKLWVTKRAGGNERNILDRQKIRGSITFLGGVIEVPINESIVSGGVSAYKSGPVRIITHSQMYPLFPMGIKGPKFYIDSIMSDTLTLTTTTMSVPFDPGSLIHDMTLAFSTDLTPSAKGMLYYNSRNLEGVEIDGKMDDKEKGLDKGKDEWRMTTGPQGTQIQFTRFDPKFLKNGEASSTYNDDETDENPPENFPGDVGAAADQIVIKSLEAGSYKIHTFGCVPENFYQGRELDKEHLEAVLAVPNRPISIMASGKEIKNQGGTPRGVIEK